jgi:hypothetical protein
VAACSSQISFEGKHDSCLCRVAACSSHISYEGKHDSCQIMFPLERYLTGTCCHSTKTRIMFPLERYLA